MVSSHPKIELQGIPEFNTLIHRLCEKAPIAARAIVVAIQNFNPQEQTMPGKGTLAEHKRKLNNDPLYRPPKSAKRTALSSHVSNNEPSSAQIDHLIAEAVTEESTRQDDSGDHSAEPLSPLDQENSEDTGSPGEGNSLSIGSTLDISGDMKCSTKILGVVSAPSKLDTSQSPVLTDSKQDGELPRSPEMGLTTLVDDGHPPSQTEEIYGGKIPPSPESIMPQPAPTPDPSLADAAPITPLKAAEIIYKFSRYQDGPSREVHARILQSLKGDNPEAAAARWDQWSDGSMWIHVLETGSSNTKRATIFNMLEYMGASEWYDGQIELAEGTILTTKGQPVGRRGAATYVLNRMQGLRMGSARQGRWISGIGRVTLEEDGPEVPLEESGDVSLTEKARKSERSRFGFQVSRGRILSTKLVRELGLGVLFCPKIWNYTKMTAKQLDILIRRIKADSSLMKLLRVLSPQLELLVKQGSPDLRSFYEDLKREELVSDKELRELKIPFALESDALPDSELDAAIDRLIERVSTKLFSKTMLGDDDTVTVNGSVELSCDIFQRLRRDEWLDTWTIIAGMQISDKPAFIRHIESVPLDEMIGRSGRPKQIKQPLAGLAKKIEKYRSEAKEIFGTGTCLVYFCPINHRNNHFTLLEINEREKVIRHYDSMADPAVVKGDKGTRISDLVKEEFGRLKYSYSEANMDHGIMP
ncbi:uncharacterized protein CDV56_104172 [Aspergillus thermomutatus]|uniref:Ubiquitin-like protease family profile domain-containing protein n=1 Tax=Aspergillus thermomutatus TaxID=41047 RepID=A0A397GAK2_ASPTH|nr:uncharacterized protein CDV56_104172 [Aspergillus thermomutatus]RHZ45973.1 hypothetical protein CDV56_104172 [Aspergillus thermomutatus]